MTRPAIQISPQTRQIPSGKNTFAPSALVVGLALARAALVVVGLFHTPAWADENSAIDLREGGSETVAPSDDHSDFQIRQAARTAAPLLDFGAIPLGTPVASPPQGAALVYGCHAGATGECGFDLNGVNYGTHWDDQIVVMKTIDVGDARPVWLPFGLEGDETISVALAPLNAQSNGAFAIASNDTGETFVIAHSSNERLDYFEVSLRFQRNGRLSEVRASCCYD